MTVALPLILNRKYFRRAEKLERESDGSGEECRLAGRIPFDKLADVACETVKLWR